MTPEQRRRAGLAVTERIESMSATPSAVARSAGISPNTLLALAHGKRWPSDEIQGRIESKLGWPGGEILRRAAGFGAKALCSFSDEDLLTELLRRAAKRQRTRPERPSAATSASLDPRLVTGLACDRRSTGRAGE